MIELTEEQLTAAKGGEPLRFAANGTEFVVLRAEVYERVRQLLEDEEDRQQTEAWLDVADEARREWAKENPY